jgi:hypothetical protein
MLAQILEAVTGLELVQTVAKSLGRETISSLTK